MTPVDVDTTTAARGRRVTDAPTRMFHLLFGLSFLGAYLSAESERWRALHLTLGYIFAGLLVFRVLYGWLGPRHAALGPWWRRLTVAPAWLRAMAQARSMSSAPWRQGQNLAMALAPVLLLALVLPLTLSGVSSDFEWGGEWLSDLHEGLGSGALAVALLHVG